MFVIIVILGFLCYLFGGDDNYISNEELYFLMEEERKRNE